MASNLIAMASNLLAMAFNLLSMPDLSSASQFVNFTLVEHAVEHALVEHVEHASFACCISRVGNESRGYSDPRVACFTVVTMQILARASWRCAAMASTR